MQDNSASRRKALIISMLLFLFAGGGIFLFFVVQGSNDLTRQGKNQNFTYGEAAREGVSSFFKSVGIVPDDEERIAIASKQRFEARGLDLPGEASASGDVSDWMAKPSASPASSRPSAPTSVPKMEGRGMAGVGGGGGGSKSAGSVSRFGGESATGVTSISSKGQASATGAGDKGTLASLKNAKALLGEGLRSGSAMTANAKWNQSFGVGNGSNRGGDLAYNKTGLVNLDKIKSGEISDLKMDKKGGLKTTEVSNPVKDADGTREALAGDKKFNKDMDEKMKQDAAKAALEAAANSINGTANDKTGTGPGNDKNTKPGDPDQPPDSVVQTVMGSKENGGMMCTSKCDAGGGATYEDQSVKFERDPNNAGNWIVNLNGTQKMPDGSTISYSDRMSFNPTTRTYIPLSSVAGTSPTNMQPVSFGGI